MNSHFSSKPETDEAKLIEISDPTRLPAKPVVSVLMLTYNHAAYLAQAIEGVLMQQTDFPIEILIGEDCSPDNSLDISKNYQREYPQIIRIITGSSNVGMTKNWDRLVAASKGEFLAICEGDDYWIDPLKLQKQVGFLQENQDYGLSYTDIDRLYVATNILEKDAFKNHLGIYSNTFEDFLINAWFLATCTWVFRANMLNSIDTYLKGPVDTQILLSISANSKVKFFNETTAVYRIMMGSASHHESSAEGHFCRKDILAIQCLYASKYSENLKPAILLNYYLKSFLNIFQFDKETDIDDAYSFLKINHKLSFKISMYYWLTKYKMLTAALRVKKKLKFAVRSVNS